jgi:hypothetical protein
MLLLKEMVKESDETVAKRWIENAYWQYFTGEDFFQTDQPFDPSHFVHFRKRIGERGLEFLLRQSVSLHPKAKTEADRRRQRWRGRCSGPLARECLENWKENFLPLF